MDGLDLEKIRSYSTDLHKDKVDRLLRGIHDEKIGSIREAIKEINELIAERTALSNDIIAEISKVVSTIESYLMQRKTPDSIKEQLELRKKQLDIEEMKLLEKVNCWRDIALLKRELREMLKEFREQESKISMLDNILDGSS